MMCYSIKVILFDLNNLDIKYTTFSRVNSLPTDPFHDSDRNCIGICKPDNLSYKSYIYVIYSQHTNWQVYKQKSTYTSLLRQLITIGIDLATISLIFEFTKGNMMVKAKHKVLPKL